MSITGSGYIFIIVGLIAFFSSRKWLYNLTIFFLPFSATAVINVGAADSGSAIQPYMFFGSLLFISSMFEFLKCKGGQFSFKKAELIAIIALFSFALIALISLAMPYFIDGKELGNQTGQLNEFIPITFTSKNISQYLYLLFGICFALLIYAHNKKEDDYIKTIRVYSWSVLFIVVWGGLELFCYSFNISYPAFLFNNSFNPAAQGYAGLFDDQSTLKRISSVATESSILVQCIIIYLPFLIFSYINKNYLFGKGNDLLFILLLVIFIIRTTSSGGIISLVVLGLIISYIYFKPLPTIKKLKFILIAGICIPAIMAVIYASFKDIVDSALLNKADTYSTLERSSSVSAAWDNFLSHPLFGVGWGSVTSFDLFIKLLSNTGVAGFAVFSFFIVKVLTKKKLSGNILKQPTWIKTAAPVSFMILIVNNAISGFSFVFGFFWLIAGLVIIQQNTKEQETLVANIYEN